MRQERQERQDPTDLNIQINKDCLVWPTLPPPPTPHTTHYSYPSTAESVGNYLLRDLHTFVPENFTQINLFSRLEAEQRVFPQKIFSNNKQKNHNCSAKTEVREGQRRTARCQNNQSRSNFPNNNNSLPLSVFVFVVGWLGGEGEGYKENLK